MSSPYDEPSPGCISKLRTNWSNFLSWMKIEYSVYPLNPVAPEHSEFVTIDSHIRIRCIHIDPDSLRESKFLEFNKDQFKNVSSFSAEEYWFTKLARPFRTESCKCSFRRSRRLFPALDQNQIVERPPCLRNDETVPKIRSVETFINQFLQDTLSKGIEEFHMINRKKNEGGVTNLAFTLQEEEVGVQNEIQDIEHSKIHLRPKSVSYLCSNNNSAIKRCDHNKSKKKKPLVILLHGIGSSSDIWWFVIKSLVSSGYEIVAPDMLGHGYSSAPYFSKCYSFHSLVLQALTVFDHYMASQENRKCILIGHSYGCSFATAVYHYRMTQISQLILISGGGPTPLAPPVAQDELVYNCCMQTLIQPLIFCGVNRSFFYSSRGKCFNAWEESCGIPNHVLNYVKSGQNWPGGDAAFHRKIFVPTLLVHGLLDKHVTLVQECEMERTIPRSFLEIIPNAGHMPMLDAPDHLIHMILCFLDCST